MKPKASDEHTKVLRAKRKHVMKDIEEWATQNLTVDLNQGNTRMSGKNDDTVTEIRMLKTRLFDLGVERYKFLNHYSHEKQKMLDLKKRKQHTLKNIRSYSSMSEPVHWRPSTSSSQPSTIHETASTITGKYYPTDQPYGEETRKAGLHPGHRHGHQRGKQNANNQRNHAMSRAKTVQFIPTGLVKDRDTRTAMSEPLRSNTPGYRGQNVIKDNVSVVSFRTTTDDDARSWASRRSRLSKFGGSVPSVTGDTRYALLEKALSINYEKHSQLPVSDIVQKIGSLHVPPKNVKEKKPKWEVKIQQFKKEAGLTW